nr:hypothetical protein [Tanacetum cinerariifolium]
LNELDIVEPIELVDRDKEMKDEMDDESTRRGLKYIDALVDPGSDVNVMPLSTNNRLTNKKPARIDISLYLDIKEDEKKPLIIGTTFLTTVKAKIRFDKGTITLRPGKNKINFSKIPESPCRVDEKTEDDIDHVTPTNTVSRLILEWEERIKYHQEKEMGFN